jgi:hypothetical protein
MLAKAGKRLRYALHGNQIHAQAHNHDRLLLSALQLRPTIKWRRPKPEMAPRTAGWEKNRAQGGGKLQATESQWLLQGAKRKIVPAKAK